LGLRTLCIAQKKLTEDEFETFDNLLRGARTALDQREEKLQLAYEAVERNVTLLGVTAVEDKLQEGVPETFIALRQAGIKVTYLEILKIPNFV
jgi:phospholipid-translocating ATPase